MASWGRKGGEFGAGRWTVWLALYFLFYFLVASSIVQGSQDVGFTNSSITVRDPGFLATDVSNYDTADETCTSYGFFSGNCTTTQLSSTSSVDTQKSGFFETVKFMSGFGVRNIDIGFPPTFRWIIAFLTFWIPGIMFAISVYFSLPFLH